MVDLPLAERPVSQIVRPCCFLSDWRIVGVMGLAWYVMLLGGVSDTQVLVIRRGIAADNTLLDVGEYDSLKTTC